ncbi:unnamed protein product [Phytomonas sp. Hart1]|nr:unnamed protein product [Phytomonas sp. Hart1]|eukprot:CCW69936.1 unnamed protein product [Phytomonas sp. isolate Hart1]
MSYLEISPEERQHVDYLADLFAIVVAIEHVEKANRRDWITQEQYGLTVRRLLEKYKHTVNYLAKGCNPHFTNIEDFMNTYCALCPAARATIKEGPFSSPSENSARFLARQALECGQYFITLLDAIRLQQTAVDALNPLLTELLQGLRKLELKDHDFFLRLEGWHARLNGMGAADTLDEVKARELAYDLERGYNCLRAYLDDDEKVKA